nr:hypothetical protein [Tanacetum cinerariifolium]
MFVLYDLTKPQVLASSIQLDRVEDLVLDEHDGIDEENLDLGEQNVKQYERKIFYGYYPAKLRVLSSFSFGVTPYNYATLENLKGKHPFKLAPFFSHIPIDHHRLIASHVVVLNMIKCFPVTRHVDEMNCVPNISWII